MWAELTQAKVFVVHGREVRIMKKYSYIGFGGHPDRLTQFTDSRFSVRRELAIENRVLPHQSFADYRAAVAAAKGGGA